MEAILRFERQLSLARGAFECGCGSVTGMSEDPRYPVGLRSANMPSMSRNWCGITCAGMA